MANVNLTQALQEEYEQLYLTCEVQDNRFAETDAIVDRILLHRARYQTVADAVDAPWYFVAAIHNMESSQRFTRHLHNGDRLTARTVHVPAGRPVNGAPPFTWEQSADDALRLQKIDRVHDWTLARTLYELEKYNGWGYRRHHPHVKSPYLWGFSNHYTSGKYIADGRWSDTAVSRQCGAAVIIRRLEERADIEPLESEADSPIFRYANNAIDRGDDLQRFLNTFDGIALRVDGWTGKRTSDAVQQLFGFRLHNDPRD